MLPWAGASWLHSLRNVFKGARGSPIRYRESALHKPAIIELSRLLRVSLATGTGHLHWHAASPTRSRPKRNLKGHEPEPPSETTRDSESR